LTTLAAILASAITQTWLAPAFESAQADADLPPGAHKACARSMRLNDQLDRLAR